MKTMDLQKIRKQLSKALDNKRFEHTQGVAYTSAALAMRYGEDIKKAELAGLLHDCAKCLDNEKKIQICKKHNISISEAEERNPFLLHAKVGGYLAKTKYKVDDDEIIQAIISHTTGRPGMSLLEKIVYIADYISAERNYPDVDVMRRLSKEVSLEEASLYALRYSIRKLESDGGIIHTDSIDYYNELIIDKRKEEVK